MADRGRFTEQRDTDESCSQEARDYGRRIEKRIVLIDGAELVTCMIEHGIGVSNEAKIEIKRLDNDYFEKE